MNFWHRQIYAKQILQSTSIHMAKEKLYMHDDVIKWKHFPRHWSFVRGIHWSPVDSPHKGQWCGALMFSLICAWSNSWAKNRDASDYEVTVMWIFVVEVLSFVLWVTGSQWPTKPDNPVTDPTTINSKITWGQSLGWEVFKIYTTPDLFVLLGPLGL